MNDKEAIVRNVLKGKSFYCDRIKKGYSLKVTSTLSGTEQLLLSMLADKVVEGRFTWAPHREEGRGCRYHFYSTKVPVRHS